ncbi:hypothetical protein SELMODRAFT_19170, partial [Selaginella moellendorffii]
SNGKNILYLDLKCNLVFYSQQILIWNSNTSRYRLSNCFLLLQLDGNLVLYSGKNSLWETNTNCKTSNGCVLL